MKIKKFVAKAIEVNAEATITYMKKMLYSFYFVSAWTIGLEGGGFLIHRLKGNVRELEIAWIEIMEYSIRQSNRIQFAPIYNNGKTIEWKSIERMTLGIHWTLTSRPQGSKDQEIVTYCYVSAPMEP